MVVVIYADIRYHADIQSKLASNLGHLFPSKAIGRR